MVLTFAVCSAWLLTTVHEERQSTTQPTQSLCQCHCLLSDSSGNLEKLVNPHCPSYPLYSCHPTTSAAPWILLSWTLQSCFQQAVLCTSFPDSSFTAGLESHRRAGNPTQAQPEPAITSTACGHSSCVNTKVGSCHSQLQHLITVTLLALNYGNTSRDFWVASTQSVTSSTTYITNLLGQEDLIKF